MANTKGGTEKKNGLMVATVFDSDSDAWEEAAVTVARSLVLDRKRWQKKRWNYKGELETTLGKKQARKFIKQKNTRSAKMSRGTHSTGSSKKKTSLKVCCDRR